MSSILSPKARLASAEEEEKNKKQGWIRNKRESDDER
jgi:hypothetical protein